MILRPVGSVVEHRPHTSGAVGSNPTPGTILRRSRERKLGKPLGKQKYEIIKRAVKSTKRGMAESHPHTMEAAGSNPAQPTILNE